MSSSRAAMVDTIDAALGAHRLGVGEDGKPACRCGWWVAPLLESALRRHQAESVLDATLLATAQINAENIAESRERLSADWQTRYQQLERKLAACQDRLLTS